MTNKSALYDQTGIAIIGMACRFPGANDYEAFWENLKNGINSIKEISFERWDINDHYSPNRNEPNKSISKWCGQIDDFDKFDNKFFNISPREAQHMDPQQRFLLEETWHCIEDSGIKLDELQRQRTAVYVGASTADYLQTASGPDILLDGYTTTGNWDCILANKISYTFGFNGVSIALDTGCASSLTAIHEGMRLLQLGEADYCIAGGVNASFHPLKFISYSKLGILSPDGKCKTFDKEGDGFVPGEGVGVLLLQRLDDAIKNQNNLYGVIRGCAENHNACTSSMTAPDVDAQYEVISKAFKTASIRPEDVSYLEAHGTGTSLGDPIEINALTRFFQKDSDKKQFCQIGSVKTNVGHLESASGMAGMIKVLMMMRYKQIPPSLYYRTPNPVINFEDSPFRVSTELQEWENEDVRMPLRAGISAFGFGGANVHMIIEAPPAPPVHLTENLNRSLFLLSAKSEYSQKRLMNCWKRFTKGEDFTNHSLHDMCLTLMSGREQFPFRFGCIVKKHDELRDCLAITPDSFSKLLQPSLCLRVGEYNWGSGKTARALLSDNRLFKGEIDRIQSLLAKSSPQKTQLQGLFDGTPEEPNTILNRFIVNYSFLNSFLESGGIIPNLIIGTNENSGIWTALTLCGMITPENTIAFLSGQKQALDIELVRPVIPYFDVVSQRKINPFYFDAKYIQKLLDKLNITKEGVEFYLSKAKNLLENQYTFRKYVDVWNQEFRKLDTDFGHLLDHANGSLDNWAKLSVLIAASCIEKLNLKWKLSEERVVSSSEFYEIVDLINDNVMPHKVIIGLLTDEKTNLDTVAEILNKNQNNIDKRKPYKHLKQVGFDGIINLSDLVGNCQCKPTANTKGILCLDYGYSNPDQPQADLINMEKNGFSNFGINQTVLELWLKGVNINFNKFNFKKSFQKVPLPAYPFQKKRHWISKIKKEVKPAEIPSVYQSSRLHPLIDRNTSTLYEQEFRTRISSKEFYFADHVVSGRKMLPGVAHLEMARASSELAEAGKICEIKNIVWAHPVVVGEETQDVCICLNPKGEIIEYDISTRNKRLDGSFSGKQLCSQGKLVPGKFSGSGTTHTRIDIQAFENQCCGKMEKEEIYMLFKEIGIEYGSGFQVIETLFYSKDQALSKLKLPTDLIDTFNEFVLHPAIMDAALQTTMGILRGRQDGALLLPFYLKSLKIINPLSKECCVHVKKIAADSGETFDIRVVDNFGRSLIQMDGFMMRSPALAVKLYKNTHYFKPVWQKADIIKNEVIEDNPQSLFLDTCFLLFDTDDKFFLKIQKIFKNSILIKPGNKFLINQMGYEINPANKEDFDQLITSLTDQSLSVDRIIWMWSKDSGSLAQMLSSGVYSLLFLSQSITSKRLGNKIRLVYVHQSDNENSDAGVRGCLNQAIAGFVKTISLENPRLIYTTLEFQDLSDHDFIFNKLFNEFLLDDQPIEVKYDNGQRKVKSLEAITDNNTNLADFSLPEKSTILITGGMGGLGLIFGKYIARKYNVNIVLAGRSELNSEKKHVISRIQASGINVSYIKADIAQYDEVVNILKKIKAQFKSLDGIIHAAGAIKDSLAFNKSRQEMEDVMAPKIQGIINLDRVVKDQNLVFFVLFSSIAGYFGNIGQCDYAYANAFMDSFADWRERLRKKGLRRGRTVSIGWPFWKKGGMKIDAQSEKRLKDRLGMIPLGTAEGLDAFERALRYGAHFIVLSGDKSKLKMNAASSSKNSEHQSLTKDTIDQELKKKAVNDLIGLCSRLLGVEETEWDIDANFEEYGVDSIMMMQILNGLEEKYAQAVSPSVISDFPTINLLSDYLVKEGLIASGRHSTDAQMENKPSISVQEMPENVSMIPEKINRFAVREDRGTSKIAVIAMSCRFPEAQDIETFWQNLMNGVNCVTEVPSNRWDVAQYYSPDKSAPGRTYSKYAGYIRNIDFFDARYFGISDHDARAIDPQQRILLELSQELFDRAGYTKKEMAKTKTGVFIGGAESSYSSLKNGQTAESQMKHYFVNRIQNMMAARISDFYDLKGVSQTIDTACSSSLVAIHEACKEMQTNGCDMAIAGGIELLLDPLVHIGFCKAKVLSDEDKSYVFDERAKGFTLGEGAGLVLLKPYEKAVQDKDRIAAVILGSAANNDGHTMGLTVPSLDGQKSVIKDALNRSQVNPESISCFEAHGTGTLLGDPIEIKAVSQVYRHYTQKKNYCAVGSVKSNIGHLLHAAGAASFIKTVLALENKKIPRTLHCETPHPRFGFGKSPFYPATQTQDWQPEQGARIAAISSFGFGGTNCHMIVGESPQENRIHQREVLPVTRFRRKRYWIGDDILDDFKENREGEPMAGGPISHIPDEPISSVCPETVTAGDIGEKSPRLKQKIEEYIKQKISSLLSVKTEDLDSQANFMDLGIDSMALIEISGEMEMVWGVELYPTLFFEYQNINALSEYFAEEYSEQLFCFFDLKPVMPVQALYQVESSQNAMAIHEVGQNTSIEFISPQKLNEDVAIIGMTGIYADSPDLSEFWQNIITSKNLIKEIPSSRFDYRPWFDSVRETSDKMYCKWGSFIDQHDRFDASFFNISPREAEFMDPQLRLLLQVMYNTAEDAGFGSRIKGTRTGVYTGVCFHDYRQELTRMGLPVNPHEGTGTASTMMANRPSFYFNLTGPSMTIDTACSSSLVALHLARKALLENECEMAFVSGANLILSSWHYRYMCSIGALSHTGKCHTFDKRANGYVPGEGVASVLLKKLTQAISDNDHIYAVIKGSAVNHGGYTPSVTAPSTNLEAAVICDAWKDAGINPENIGYVEAHGTGTQLGDPIEINALKHAFGQFTDKEKFCAIGSAKAHIGHSEGAAGITGVIKAVLSINHKKIPAMPDFQELNPYVKLERTPLYINEKNLDWDIQPGQLRCAGVSSFGFGGAYAHVVLEEHSDQNLQKGRPLITSEVSYIFVLSGRNIDRLKEYSEKIVCFLEKATDNVGNEKVTEFVERKVIEIVSKIADVNELEIDKDAALNEYGFDLVQLSHLREEINTVYGIDIRVDILNDQTSLASVVTSLIGNYRSSLDEYHHLPFQNKYDHAMENSLADIAYTSQVGREAMEERLSLIVYTREELMDKLLRFVAGDENIENLYLGNTRKNKERLAGLDSDEDMAKTIDAWITKKKYSKLLDLWVNGLSFDWNRLYSQEKPKRISLPTYPFATERHWIDGIGTTARFSSEKPAGKLHPLVHENTSDLTQQRFSARFNGEEFFLSDHMIQGKMVLPGVAYLEMARVAFELSTGGLNGSGTGLTIRDIVWITPIILGNAPLDIHIRLFPQENEQVSYEVYSHPVDEEPVVHSQGTLLRTETDDDQAVNIEALKKECAQNRIGSKEYYKAFKKIGLEYGTCHQGIEELYIGEGKVFSKLTLPAPIRETIRQFILHPSMMDAALQSCMGLFMERGALELVLPFALDQLEIIKDCTESMWALARYDSAGESNDVINKIDIDLFDEDGRVCVRLKGFASRVQKHVKTVEELMFKPLWKEKAINSKELPSYENHIIALCEPGATSFNRIQKKTEGAELINLKSSERDADKKFYSYAQTLFEAIRKILKEKPKNRVLFQVLLQDETDHHLFTGFSGLLKTAHQENPNFIGQLIEGDNTEFDQAFFEQNGRHPEDIHIRYRNGRRWVEGLDEIQRFSKTPEGVFKDKGVYLISGGLGGLGFIFAKEIAEKVRQPVLILTGRSESDKEKKSQLEVLKKKGARVEYKRVDVQDLSQVQHLINRIETEHHGLNGIIHCAGILKDNFIINKPKAEFKKTLGPKVAGIVNLDEASKGVRLDFLVVFSSFSSVWGNIGQSDYACANGFMDAYAGYRDHKVAIGQRFGKTLSFNWPFWEKGGMQVSKETERMMVQNTGMVPLQTEAGFRAFYLGMGLKEYRLIPVQGYGEQLHSFVMQEKKHSQATREERKHVTPKESGNKIREKAEKFFKDFLSSAIKLPVHKIDVAEPLEKYGIDSVMILQLTDQLEEIFGPLSKTLFFEYQNIRDLTGYFLESYYHELLDKIQISPPSIHGSSMNAPDFKDNREKIESRRRSRFSLGVNKVQKIRGNDIAIIGLSGRYPLADNIDDFWQNLKEGKDCITEVPLERWDHRLYFDSDRSKAGKTDSRWGGFINGVDKFDPMFFNITPAVAKRMAPEQRLFLESVYGAIENAGYTKTNIGNAKRNIGVFVGVMWGDYDLIGVEESLKGNFLLPDSSYWSIANRISYFFDFKGPSLAIDSACSSSLSAIHMACESIGSGESSIAIAGGVNLSIHPMKYIGLTAGGFTSSDGRCRSFGEGGDGYVPGEGVGTIVLKSLSAAIRDEDQIYGVIKGSSINHGGRSNGFTVPNPGAHRDLISEAIKKSGIDPRRISYVEAHGTGTSLGDPIEIKGLTDAFKAYTDAKQFCPIGSVKSNIGHLEAAAGVAAVTKVLLQLKNKQLVPSIHSDVLNPNINFADTPFYVQRALGKWPSPQLEVKKGNTECLERVPRAAMVSSFGAGGSNAHVIIQEYEKERHDSLKLDTKKSYRDQEIIILSAIDDDRLKVYASALRRAVEGSDDIFLPDMAYTLQVGREEFASRLALVVRTKDELILKLESFENSSKRTDDLYTWNSRLSRTVDIVIGETEEEKTLIKTLFQNGDYSKLASFWVTGSSINWEALYRQNGLKRKRISLPGYPFAREKYWIPIQEKVPMGGQQNLKRLHPLLDALVPSLKQAVFKKRYAVTDEIIKDHVFNGRYLVAAVCQLEMARAAGCLVGNEAVFGLERVFFFRPMVVPQKGLETEIRLSADGDNILFKITCDDKLHSKGTLLLNSTPEIEPEKPVDLDAIKAKCSQEITGKDLYRLYQEKGLIYGESFKGLDKVWGNRKVALGRIRLSSLNKRAFVSFGLHPTILDASIQSIIGIEFHNNEERFETMAIPYSFGRIEIHDDVVLKDICYVYSTKKKAVNEKGESYFDVHILDENGVLAVGIQNFCVKNITTTAVIKINNKNPKEIKHEQS